MDLMNYFEKKTMHKEYDSISEEYNSIMIQLQMEICRLVAISYYATKWYIQQIKH